MAKPKIPEGYWIKKSHLEVVEERCKAVVLTVEEMYSIANSNSPSVLKYQDLMHHLCMMVATVSGLHDKFLLPPMPIPGGEEGNHGAN